MNPKIAIIQCAGKKIKNPGNLKASDGRMIKFVANPDKVPPDDHVYHYARPDECDSDGISWRQKLLEYNQTPNNNPLGLSRAFELYEPKPPYTTVYRDLVQCFGVENTYILSAGWGMIRANFLTPDYNITFSSRKDVPKSAVRKANDNSYEDFRLPNDVEGDFIFFGTPKYASLLRETIEQKEFNIFVYRRNDVKMQEQGFKIIDYRTRTSTNWQYECLRYFLESSSKTD